MEHTNWLLSSTSSELWSTQTDYQVHHLQNYGAHQLITKFNIFRTMEHTNWLPSSSSSQLWNTNWLPSSTSSQLWRTQTDYQVQHLQNYGAHNLITKFTIFRHGAHKLITKFIIFRTMEHTNWLPSSTSLKLWSTQTDYQVHHLHNYGTQTDYCVQHLQMYNFVPGSTSSEL